MQGLSGKPVQAVLLDFGFFVDNMLTDHRIKLLDLHLFWHVTLVLVGSVEVTSFSAGNQLDLLTVTFSFSHFLLHLLATGTKFSDNDFNAFLVDDAHTFGGNAQLYETLFAF